MQNDSFSFPHERFGDNLYDLDGDGKLSGFETALRDSDLLAEAEDAMREEADDLLGLRDLEDAFDEDFDDDFGDV